MVATVVALYNSAGPITPPLYGRRMEEVLSKKLAVLVAAAMMALSMLAASVPAFAQGGCKAFGIEGVVDQARFRPGSMGAYASFFGPQDAMDDVIHQSQEDFCG